MPAALDPKWLATARRIDKQIDALAAGANDYPERAARLKKIRAALDRQQDKIRQFAAWPPDPASTEPYDAIRSSSWHRATGAAELNEANARARYDAESQRLREEKREKWAQTGGYERELATMGIRKNEEWGQKLAITAKDRQRWEHDRFRGRMTESKQRQEKCKVTAAAERKTYKGCREKEAEDRRHLRDIHRQTVRQRGAERTKRAKVSPKIRAAESDDEVRASLPRDLLDYWETVKEHYPRTLSPNARREKFERDTAELGAREWAHFLDQQIDEGAQILAAEEAKRYAEEVPF